MVIRRAFLTIVFVWASLFVFGCHHSTSKKIKVAASTVPHAEILEEVKGELKKEGIDLIIVEIDDYALPNRLLSEEVVDANFFQHIPYLEAEKKAFGYDINWIAKVHVEPIAIYSDHLTSLSQLPNHGKVAVPSDPSNETRALRLLADKGLLTFREDSGAFLTVLDIKENPKNLKIEELDAALLTHSLQDVDIAVIPGNYALLADLDIKNALGIESKDTPYINVLVVRSGEGRREELKKLAAALNSDAVRRFIQEKYKGRLFPVF